MHESRYLDRDSQICLASFLIVRKALHQAIGLLTVFSQIRLRRCCKLLS